MNKFGIFNLLNSFFNVSSNKNSDHSTNSSNQPLSDNPLESFLSSLKNNTEKPEQTKDLPATSKPQTKKPLISPLLNTMNSHEQFVKRVTANSLTKK